MGRQGSFKEGQKKFARRHKRCYGEQGVVGDRTGKSTGKPSTSNCFTEDGEKKYWDSWGGVGAMLTHYGVLPLFRVPQPGPIH